MQRAKSASLTALRLFIFFLLNSVSLFAVDLPIDLSGPSSDWITLMEGTLFDPGNDTQAQADADLVGTDPTKTVAVAALLMAYDDNGTDSDTRDDEVGFRIRADHVLDNADRYSGTIWLGADLDGDFDVDVFIQVRGKGGLYTINLYESGSDLNVSPSTTSIANGTLLKILSLGDDFEVELTDVVDVGSDGDVDVDGDPDKFISFKLKFDSLAGAMNAMPLTNEGGALIGSIANGDGFTKDTPMQFVIATSTQDNSFNTDVGGYDGGIKSNVSYDDQGAFTPPVSLAGVPTIISDGGGDTAIVEMAVNGVNTEVTTVEAVHAVGESVTYSIIGGADAASLSIDPVTGVLNFITAPTSADVLAGTTYSVTVQSLDSTGGIDTQELTITLADSSSQPPLLVSSSPADDEIGVLINRSIILEFDKELLSIDPAGIEVYLSTGSKLAGFNITFSDNFITIDPIADFVKNKTYYILINNTAVRGIDGNYYAGLTLDTDLNFDTEKTGAIDTAVPAVPVITTMADDTGTDLNDHITNDYKQIFSGTADPLNTIELFLDGVSIGFTNSDPITGNWTFDYTGISLSDQIDYVLTATATNLVGNTASSTDFIFTVDTIANVTVGGVTADSGSSSIDGITNDNELLIYGTAEAGDPIEVFVDGLKIGDTTANGSGDWSFDYTGTTLIDDSYVVTASSSDIAGNSALSSEFTVVIDTSLPAVPTVISKTTADTTPAISGTATLEAGETLSVTVNGAVYDDVTIDANGNWTIDTAVEPVSSGTLGTFSNGSYDVTAVTSDLAGNTVTDITAAELTIDSTAPVSPTVNGLVTNDTTPTLTGIATVGTNETLSVTVNGVTYDDVVVNTDGTWSLTLPNSAALADANYTVTAIVTNTVTSVFSTGNGPLAIDTVSPSKPTVVSQSTADSTPTIIGSVIVLTGDTLTVTVNGKTYTDGDGQLILVGTTWYLNIPVADSLADGTHEVIATVSDQAGNTISDDSTAELIIATAYPTIPTVNSLTTIIDTPTITGNATLVAGESLTVKVDGITYSVGDGNLTHDSVVNTWSLDIPGVNALADATYEVKATITNTASNYSNDETTMELTVNQAGLFVNQAHNYPENQITGAVVATLVASNTGFVFQATGTAISADGFYEVDSLGNITITTTGVASALNDYEVGANSSSYVITSNGTEDASITLNITNVDEASSFVNQTFNYDENQLANAPVATLIATVADDIAGYVFKDSGTATSADGFYTIDNSGEITITMAGVNSSVNDYEYGANSADYIVTLTDGFGSTAEATVTLGENDVADLATPTLENVVASGIIYGQSLADSILTGEAKNGLDLVPGTWTFNVSIENPAVSDSGITTYDVTFTPDDLANYTVATTSVTLPVLKASLSVTGIDQSRTLGDTNPVLNYSITGFVLSETQAVIDSLPATSTLADSASAVGEYPITISGGNDDNYSFRYFDGDLSILATAVPIIISDGGTDMVTVKIPEASIAITTVAATDADDDDATLVYSIVGGLDKNEFTIDLSTGLLNFKVLPDFDEPTDSNLDNDYIVVVKVSDADGGFDTQTITVTVEVLSPAIGLEAIVTNGVLLLTLEDEVGVKEYQIYDADSGKLVDTITAVDEDYILELPNGITNITVKVVDINGFSQTFIPSDGNKINTIYNLQNGWNLIAMAGENADLSALEAVTVGDFWAWNGTGYETINAPVPCQGIWVYSENNVQVMVSAERSDTEISLETGWNVVGPTENIYVPKAALAVFAWNATYEEIVGQNMLIQGIGYWIFSL